MLPLVEKREGTTSGAALSWRNNLQAILDQHIKNRYDLEIIDVHQQPLLVEEENVTAVPMLVKKQPQPKKRLIGDMSDTARVLRGLGLT